MNEVDTFSDLNKWIVGLPNEQFDGTTGAVCEQTGGEYTELFETHFARSGDENVAERAVARRMQRAIRDFIGGSSAPIFWRKCLEHQIHSTSQVVVYAEDGPDIDFYTDRRCVKDHNWKRAAAYCRLAIAKEK